MEVIGGAMPLMAGCGAMPLDGDGCAKLPHEDNGVMCWEVRRREAVMRISVKLIDGAV